MRILSRLKAGVLHRYRSKQKRGLTSAHLQLLTSYLAIMLGCGMHLVQALHVLAESGEFHMQLCADNLARDIESGMKLSQAMSRQPETFSAGYRRVVETAEATGRVGETLARLTITLDKQAQTARRVSGALVYPACLLCSSAALVFGMLYFIFPMLIRVTEDAGVPPPALTKALIFVSSPKIFLVLLILSLLIGLGFRSAWRSQRVGPPLQRFTEEHFPLARFINRTRVLACIRQLGMMLESGVDLLKSIQYAGKVGEGSLLVREAFEDIFQRVKFGQTLTSCLARHSVFPKVLTGMVSVADQVGDTHLALYRFCDLFEDTLNNEIDSATSLIEPILMASMGLIIGFILVAAFLPIYNLVQL